MLKSKQKKSSKFRKEQNNIPFCSQATFTDSTTTCCDCSSMAVSRPSPTICSWATMWIAANNRWKPFACCSPTRSSIRRTFSCCAATTSAPASTGYTGELLRVDLWTFRLILIPQNNIFFLQFLRWMQASLHNQAVEDIHGLLQLSAGRCCRWVIGFTAGNTHKSSLTNLSCVCFHSRWEDLLLPRRPESRSHVDGADPSHYATVRCARPGSAVRSAVVRSR